MKTAALIVAFALTPFFTHAAWWNPADWFRNVPSEPETVEVEKIVEVPVEVEKEVLKEVEKEVFVEVVEYVDNPDHLAKIAELEKTISEKDEEIREIKEGNIEIFSLYKQANLDFDELYKQTLKIAKEGRECQVMMSNLLDTTLPSYTIPSFETQSYSTLCPAGMTADRYGPGTCG